MFMYGAILTLFAYMFLKYRLYGYFCGFFAIILVSNPKVA